MTTLLIISFAIVVGGIVLRSGIDGVERTPSQPLPSLRRLPIV